LWIYFEKNFLLSRINLDENRKSLQQTTLSDLRTYSLKIQTLEKINLIKIYEILMNLFLIIYTKKEV